MIPRPSWYPDWRGEVAIIVASGPSAKEVDLERARQRARFITVNDSWRLAPWADVAYGNDFEFWHKWDGLVDFSGLKVTTCSQAADEYGLKLVYCNRVGAVINMDGEGEVGWGGNSAFGALNLAIHFGVKHIVMVGLDLTLAHGSHWHGDHPPGMSNPQEKNIKRWRKAFEHISPFLSIHRIKVWNVSEISALTCFEKIRFEGLFPLEETNGSAAGIDDGSARLERM